MTTRLTPSDGAWRVSSTVSGRASTPVPGISLSAPTPATAAARIARRSAREKEFA